MFNCENTKKLSPRKPDVALKMSNHKLNFIGWVLFVISAIAFYIASIGHIPAMFGSILFLIACIAFVIPFFREEA